MTKEKIELLKDLLNEYQMTLQDGGKLISISSILWKELTILENKEADNYE